ncbi:coiled-coil protein [Legionella quinlivanii]|uniref:Coiled-coil protein n=1 Tax=Legionella quinlivanii TaxID=45073 RepID=A0A0W0Y0F2_9GAMM|nr:hypothetical protein [Legionella quinlivanii]KTD50192.1 coiled-coil protein [Legionella quinlivanii]MCW8450063.1 hypothetical protein [Legionella quinlivanii]SEF48040.1 hypothetical protein SAMN02746093_00320 [Legionella quinlivanii DSM 21216]STY11790.1 coiled-coil protein [Legionella quinlivanii]
MPRSSKGFIAIDIDGTTLVEKIDKNPLYGLRNKQSHMRQVLLEYVRRAQKEGYDILILTARPGIVDRGLQALSNYLGTKPTNEIVNILEAYDVHNVEIVRAPAGLKGHKMAEILQSYHQEGHHDAIGLLFDDQLKQVNDVIAQNNSQLVAIDINSASDLDRFWTETKIPVTGRNPFHPQNLIKDIKETHREISLLYKNIEQIRFAQEAELITKIVDDLSIRIYEAKHRDYHPEINWVNNAITGINTIINKLSKDRPHIRQAELNAISQLIFGTDDLSRIVPNSQIEVLLQDLMIDLKDFVLRDELLKTLKDYQSRFQANALVKEQPGNLIEINRLNQLIDKLETIPQASEALAAFANTLQKNESEYRSSSWWQPVDNLLNQSLTVNSCTTISKSHQFRQRIGEMKDDCMPNEGSGLKL